MPGQSESKRHRFATGSQAVTTTRDRASQRARIVEAPLKEKRCASPAANAVPGVGASDSQGFRRTLPSGAVDPWTPARETPGAGGRKLGSVGAIE
jgi:hypothetical protein